MTHMARGQAPLGLQSGAWAHLRRCRPALLPELPGLLTPGCLPEQQLPPWATGRESSGPVWLTPIGSERLSVRVESWTGVAPHLNFHAQGTGPAQDPRLQHWGDAPGSKQGGQCHRAVLAQAGGSGPSGVWGRSTVQRKGALGNGKGSVKTAQAQDLRSPDAHPRLPSPVLLLPKLFPTGKIGSCFCLSSPSQRESRIGRSARVVGPGSLGPIGGYRSHGLRRAERGAARLPAGCIRLGA